MREANAEFLFGIKIFIAINCDKLQISRAIKSNSKFCRIRKSSSNVCEQLNIYFLKKGKEEIIKIKWISQVRKISIVQNLDVWIAAVLWGKTSSKVQTLSAYIRHRPFRQQHNIQKFILHTINYMDDTKGYRVISDNKQRKCWSENCSGPTAIQKSLAIANILWKLGVWKQKD